MQGIKDKMSKKLGWCLSALLLPREDFVAMRLQKALAAWFTDKGALFRLLGGLDGQKMQGVLAAYERKYDVPLASEIKKQTGGNFAKAALTWIRVLDDPAGGVEGITEKEVSQVMAEASDEQPAADLLTEMCDLLLLENEMLLRFAASLDVETLAEAIAGYSTDDTLLIRTLTTRSKRFLGRISWLYRERYEKSLSSLVDENCGSDW